MTTIHTRIRERRTHLELSMEDLAAKVGVRSWQTVQQWENGSTAPSRKRMEAVAAALQTTETWLLYGETGSPKVRPLVRHSSPDIAEVVRLMESADDAGRKLALNLVRAALENPKASTKKGAAR